MMSPEEKWILHCIHTLITGEPVNEPPELDWDQVMHLAEVNRLMPILQHSRPEEYAPEEAVERITESSRRQRMRAAVLIDEFQRIQTAFHSHQIELIPIKGIVESQLAYPSPSMRYFDDIDILIRNADGDRALGTLKELGYEPHPNAPRPEWHHLPPYIHRKRGTLVEIHIDLIRRSQSGWSVEDVWSRSYIGQLRESTARLLSPSDRIVLAALHARHNLYQRLSAFLDITLICIEAMQKENFSVELASRARQAGACCALAYSLRTAGDLFSIVELPLITCSRSKMQNAQRIGGWDSLESKSLAVKVGPLSRAREMLLMDSLNDSLALGTRLVFPSRSFVDSSAQEESSALWHYARRLGSRLEQAAGQIVSLLRKN
ncbi:MAG: nucleotidyltransferase family protein [Candidatus Promineifilaceae bacterium]